MMKIYSYLEKETAPQLLVQAISFIGTKEVAGKVHSNIIMNWAKDLGIEKTYTNDEIAWCGLFMAAVCKRAGISMNMTAKESLWALNWNKFGTRQKIAMLGDILTFSRNGGGHVGIYVGEDDKCYHVLGGNQSDMVCITRIEKTRLSQIRRTSWKVAQPQSVRRIILNSQGIISTNEA
jgi:uncharacterized protein (TIGR02594 family)